ncbi:MAG: TraM recognition domain-containing protein [Lewinella sp.]|nr:TraM recognition domain-containing protein [Lewinella sp.]
MAQDPVLDHVLFYLTRDDSFTIGQACEGVQIFGGIGSGKSSGSGATLARSYLQAGMGGLVLCVKPDERVTWQEYARQTGREDDLIIFDSSGNHQFNFLDYEMRRPGAGAGYSNNIVRLFTNIVEAIEGQKSGGGDSQYWIMAMQQLIRNAIDILGYTDLRQVSLLPLLYRIVNDAPRSLAQLNDPDWRARSLVNKIITDSLAKRDATEQEDPWRASDFDAAATYWMQEFPMLDERPRSGIISQFTTMADNFMRRPFRQLFCHQTSVMPEDSIQRKIIIMDLPVKEFSAAGRASQVMMKFLWQQAMERRSVKKNPRPVFLWADEAQNFISEYDMQFQATARSSRCCTVFITQNMPNYYAEMGTHAVHRTQSLVGNFATKIWHANSDFETNEKAAETIGKTWQEIMGSSESATESSGASITTTRSQVFEYEMPPQVFTRLRKGGYANDFNVEGIVFQNGRIFSNGKTYIRTAFNQRA